MPAFFDGIGIYQNIINNDALYSKGMVPISLAPEPSLGLVASSELEQQGGVVSVARFSGVYDAEEFHQYLTELKATIQEPVGLVLGANNLHAIFVGFDPKKNKFVLSNANQLSAPCQYLNTMEELERKIKGAFQFDEKFVLRTTVFSAKSDQAATEKQCENWLEKLKNIHQVTPEKAAYSDWIHYAVKQGQVELVDKIRHCVKNTHSLFFEKHKKTYEKHLEEAKKINELRTMKKN